MYISADRYTGWPKNHDTGRNLNISPYRFSKRTDFGIDCRGLFNIYFYMDMFRQGEKNSFAGIRIPENEWNG